MTNWIGRSGDGSEDRYTAAEAERNRALAAEHDGALRAYKVRRWMAGESLAKPTRAELEAEGFVVLPADVARAIADGAPFGAYARWRENGDPSAAEAMEAWDATMAALHAALAHFQV